ncbi:59cbd2bc-236a-4f44-bea9-fbf7a29eed27 [Thermothielavioides terrestris]|uniref:59cbd2bc-236a-4f44-bea9-fbf7a29eed27 n=1 Tax=Thermothielavioides terrestris TaxID=2587410 RepID=A0A446B6N3_9PEZI|nr:59cbd2bc-236a-4f44-bea9-fbf7a29eed27 [Thermothielavioides terrestris]
MPTKSTILEELTKPLPKVVNHARPGANTTNPTWPDIGQWVEWTDFTAQKLRAQFRGIVDAEWTIRDNLYPRLSHWDTEFFDEDDAEHSIISRCIIPPVNAALSHALKRAKLDAAFDLNLGRAGRTYEDPSFDRRQKPDWALCSVDRKSTLSDGSFRYDNLLPGDSKLSNKWHSSWCQRSDLHPGYLQVWKDPVRQILSYCRHNRCRYGFLITDAELVVMRVTPMPTAESSVTTRQASQAEALAAHYRHISTSTTMSSLSSSLRDMSLDSSSSYRPTDLAEDGYIVEYRAIPWGNRGQQDLTVQLGLFYLAWLAGIGPNTLKFSYPSFDSCWPLLDGTFIHNTTGLALEKAVKLEYPDPAVERGPRWVETTDGQSVLTLKSVLTLDITHHQGRNYYYYLHDDGETQTPTLITAAFIIYDEENQLYGYFDSLVWKVGDPAEASTSSRRRRK